MKRIFIIVVLLVISFTGCKKNDGTKFSGTITIDNILYGTGPYYALGFSVIGGEKLSTLSSPLDVISLQTDADINYVVKRVYFATGNFRNSFFRYGEYLDAASAASAFTNLKTFSTPAWIETGDTLRPNQIWLYRTSGEKYAKLRIIDTMTMKKPDMPFPYGECTFEWVYQPDGTQTFPGK